MNKKLKKLINNPSMFFRDFFYKRRNRLNFLKKVEENVFSSNKLYVFLSGELDKSVDFVNQEFYSVSGNVRYFYAEANSYWEISRKNGLFTAEIIENNPIKDLGEGYSLFLHSADKIGAGFIKSTIAQANVRKVGIVLPSFYEAINYFSAPVKRKIKTKNEFVETVNGLLISNIFLRKIPQYDEISWDAFDGSHLMLGVISVVDKNKIYVNKIAKYIYVKKPFGSAFRFSRDEGVANNCVLYMKLITSISRNLKLGNEDIFFPPLTYSLIKFVNFGFSKKNLAWVNKFSFDEYFSSLLLTIPNKYLIEFENLLNGRNKLFFERNKFSFGESLIYLKDFDSKGNQYLFSCYSRSLNFLEETARSLNGGFVCHKKIVKHQYFNDDSVLELRLWVGRPVFANEDLFFRNRKLAIGNRKLDFLNRLDFDKFIAGKNYHFDYSSEFSKCWLLMDRDDQADDNAEHLYRYLMNLNGFDKEIYFCIRADSHDWNRLEQDGFKLIEYGTKRHEAALNASDKIISSHAAAFVFDYFKDKRLFKKDLVFLQHGVTYNDLSSLFEPEWKKIGLLITAAKNEYINFVDEKTPYKFTSKEVKLTGFPRHDKLLEKDRNYRESFPNRKSILIMPTWRPYLLGAVKSGTERELIRDFEKSNYFIFWSNFLKSEYLKNIAEKGINIDFFPHANVKQYLDKFNLPSCINVMSFSDIGIQDVFARASLMITDYSSVAFEMAYLKKPVIYYQFDDEEFYSKGLYNEGYFSTRLDGFGPVSSNENELILELKNIINRDFLADDVYAERMENFFPYRDGKSCERVLESILNLDCFQDFDTNNEKYLGNIIDNRSYKQAFDVINDLNCERHQHLLQFLNWRLYGKEPERIEYSPYKILYEADLLLLNFDFENLLKLEFDSKVEIPKSFLNEFYELKSNISIHLEGELTNNDIFNKEIFYGEMLNCYFSGNWSGLIDVLKDKKNFSEISNFNFRDWNFMKLLVESLSSDDYDLLINYCMIENKWNSKPLIVYKCLNYDGVSIENSLMKGSDYEKSCLIFAKIFMKKESLLIQ